MASAIDAAPWFGELQHYKPALFAGSAAVLALNHWLVIVRPRRCRPGDVCHADTPFMRFNRRLYWTSLILFGISLLLTYGSSVVVRWR